MNVITLASRKGGAGKSTLTAQLAAQCHVSGKRTLIIDADPQGSLSLWHSLRRDGLPKLVTPERGLERAIAHTVGFWASEEAVLEPLYGAAAVDPAAGDLVARQRADRRGEFGHLLARLEEAGRLRTELSSAEALGVLLVLTSFETFRELHRLAGLEERDVTATLQASARALLGG